MVRVLAPPLRKHRPTALDKWLGYPHITSILTHVYPVYEGINICNVKKLRLKTVVIPCEFLSTLTTVYSNPAYILSYRRKVRITVLLLATEALIELEVYIPSLQFKSLSCYCDWVIPLKRKCKLCFKQGLQDYFVIRL